MSKQPDKKTANTAKTAKTANTETEIPSNYVGGANELERELMRKNLPFKKNIDEYYKGFFDYRPPIWDMSWNLNHINDLKRDLVKIGVKFYFIKWSKKTVENGIENENIIFEKEHEDELSRGNFVYFSEQAIYLASVMKQPRIDIVTVVDPEKAEACERIIGNYFSRKPGKNVEAMRELQKRQNEERKQGRVPRDISDPKIITKEVCICFENKELRQDPEPFIKIIQAKALGRYGEIKKYPKILTSDFRISFTVREDMLLRVRQKFFKLKVINRERVRTAKFIPS
jgi:hypothetical protein